MPLWEAGLCSLHAALPLFRGPSPPPTPPNACLALQVWTFLWLSVPISCPAVPLANSATQGQGAGPRALAAR